MIFLKYKLCQKLTLAALKHECHKYYKAYYIGLHDHNDIGGIYNQLF